MTVSRPTRSRPRAFSLLELLVALAIGLALLGALYAFSWQLLVSRDRMLEMTRQRRAASIVIDRLERDLAVVITADARGGAGLRGDATGLELLTRQVLARRAPDDPAAAFGDLERSQYRFDASRARLELARAEPATTPAPSAVDGAIERIRFRYHDGETWQDAFDSAASSHLPVAVELAIWFGGGPADAGAAPDTTPPAESDPPARPPDRLRVMAIIDGGPPEEADDAES